MLKKLIFVLTYNVFLILICTWAISFLWENYASKIAVEPTYIRWLFTCFMLALITLCSSCIFQFINNLLIAFFGKYSLLSEDKKL